MARLLSGSMTRTIPIAFAGATLHADLSGALFWPEESTMIVADLHFEKGSSFAARRRAHPRRRAPGAAVWAAPCGCPPRAFGRPLQWFSSR